MSKLTRDHARKQAARLQSSPMISPQTDEGRKEIVDCLMRNCQSEEHAVSVMTGLLDSALVVKGPITAWIAALARQTQTAEAAPAGCAECYLGPDLQTGEVRWANHVVRLADHVSQTPPGEIGYAMRCSCDRGKWLAAKDAERKATAAAKAEKAATASRRQHPADADWARRAAGDDEEDRYE